MGADTLFTRFAASSLLWCTGILAIIAWRQDRRKLWAPLALTLLELGVLYYMGPIPWGRSIRLPDESPVLRRLESLSEAGLIAAN